MTKDLATRDSQQSLFRQAALQASGYRVFSGVVVAIPPVATFSLLVSAIVLFALGAVAVLVEVPMRSRAIGVLTPTGGFIDVVASEQGRVEKIFVQSGSVVGQGGLLLTVISGDGSMQGQSVARLRRQSLLSELSLLAQAYAGNRKIAVGKALSLKQQLAAASRRLELGSDVLRAYEQQLELLERRFIRSEKLLMDGHVARDVVERDNENLLGARATRAKQRLHTNELRQAVRTLQRSHDDLFEQDALRAVDYQIDVERLLRQISLEAYRDSGEYRAVENSSVAHLLVQPGAVVRAGQVLAKLRRPGSDLEAWLYVSTSDARMLDPGQTVEIRLDAYPQQVFGTLTAMVSSVSGVALLPQQLGVPLLINGPVFEIRATLGETFINSGSTSWSLQPGVSFQADIVQQRLRLYEWLTRSLFGDSSALDKRA